MKYSQEAPILVSIPGARVRLDGLAEAIQSQKTQILKEIGNAVADATRKQIKSANGWTPLSKWGQAKTGQSKALRGAEKYVKVAVTANQVRVYGDTGSKWTLTQHHEGFVAEVVDEEEDQFDLLGRVVIDLANPAPLGVRGTEFAWFANNAGIVPKRKIWLNKGEVEAIALPIAQRWIKKLVSDATND